MSGGVKESKLAAREARTRSVTLLRMTTALPKKEVFFNPALENLARIYLALRLSLNAVRPRHL